MLTIKKKFPVRKFATFGAAAFIFGFMGTIGILNGVTPNASTDTNVAKVEQSDNRSVTVNDQGAGTGTGTETAGPTITTTTANTGTVSVMPAAETPLVASTNPAPAATTAPTETTAPVETTTPTETPTETPVDDPVATDPTDPTTTDPETPVEDPGTVIDIPILPPVTLPDVGVDITIGG